MLRLAADENFNNHGKDRSPTDFAVELSDVNHDIKLSENPERSLANHRGEENVGVSDDAFDKHESPL